MHIAHMLNEAYDYEKPAPFSRGTILEFGGYNVLLISGTASVNEKGKSVHKGDLAAQAKRTFANISALLKSENMNWHDIVYTRIYLKNIERDYEALCRERLLFFKKVGIDDYPASCCIEAKLCRPELLVEIEAIALKEKKYDHENL